MPVGARDATRYRCVNRLIKTKGLVMRHVLKASALSLACVAMPVLADDTELCGTSGAADWPRIQEIFTGEWEITHQAGFVRAGGMVLPFPADGEVDTLTIFQLGDTLQATHPEMQEPMVLRLADEPRWTVNRDDPYKPAPPMSPDDIGLVHGCDQMELPRLIGTSTAVVDGVQMNFTYRMMAMTWADLYGFMEVDTVAHGYSVNARRTVVMHLIGE